MELEAGGVEAGVVDGVCEDGVLAAGVLYLRKTRRRCYLSALACPRLHLIFHPNYLSLAYRG
jgi:hypothetical protein